MARRIALVSLALLACSRNAPSLPGPSVSATVTNSSPPPQRVALEEISGMPLRSLPSREDGPACETAGYVAPKGASLDLDVVANGAIADVGLRNAGKVAVCVYSHVATHELQHDWLTIQYNDGAKYHHFARVLHFDDARDKAAVVSTLLRPGEVIWHRFDLANWAARQSNGAEPLMSNKLAWPALAVYDTTRESRAWRGRVEKRFTLKLR